MDSQEIVRDDAIALFYEAAVDPTIRRRGLSVLTQMLNAAGAFYLVWDGQNGRVRSCETAGMLKAEFAVLYRDRWGAEDPRRKFLERAHGESIFASQYDLDEADLQNSAFYRQFLAPQGIGHTLAANLTEAAGVYRQIYVERSLDQQPFSAEDTLEFRRFVRQMANAERLAVEIEERSRVQTLPKYILDNMSVGTIVADEACRIHFANAAAADILSDGDGLARRDGRLQAGRSFEMNGLTAHIRGAIDRSGESDLDGRAMLIARPSGKRPYAVIVMPLVGQHTPGTHTAAQRALLFVTDLDHRNNELAPRLVQLFGLSKAEARVAAGIAEGRRLQEVAQEFNVRMPTVRTQLRAVLKKIGANRQADLVRIILALPPIMPQA
jgi:DNA-binding CsgD family transcriptional regulator